MQKNKFLNSNISKNRLLRHTKSNNIQTPNTIHNILKNNTTLIFSFLPIAFFILLDYYTLSYNFHFSSASFTEIYFNSLNLSSQILVLVSVFPLVIIFVFFTIPYLNSLVLGIHNSSAIYFVDRINIDINATYLPISNEMKLYFKKADENITCIYAINKKFDKNQYNHILQDIGFINTQKRGRQ